MPVTVVTGDQTQRRKLGVAWLVASFRLTALPRLCPTVFPLNKEKGGVWLIEKVFHVGVLIYFVIPVLITVEKPPL